MSKTYDDFGIEPLDSLCHAWNRDEPMTAEMDAALRLYEAAPAMLTALQECVTDDGAQAIVTNDIAYMIRRFKAINRIARDAIALTTAQPSVPASAGTTTSG